MTPAEIRWGSPVKNRVVENSLRSKDGTWPGSSSTTTISAWNGKARPAYAALLEDVIDLDHPVRTCIAGEVDLSTDAGRAIARTLTARGRHESDVKSRRLCAKHEQLAQSGAWASGRCFGYTNDGQVIPTEAVIIREIANRLLSGESLRSVTKWFGDSGVPTVRRVGTTQSGVAYSSNLCFIAQGEARSLIRAQSVEGSQVSWN